MLRWQSLLRSLAIDVHSYVQGPSSGVFMTTYIHKNMVSEYRMIQDVKRILFEQPEVRAIQVDDDVYKRPKSEKKRKRTGKSADKHKKKGKGKRSIEEVDKSKRKGDDADAGARGKAQRKARAKRTAKAKDKGTGGAA